MPKGTGVALRAQRRDEQALGGWGAVRCRREGTSDLDVASSAMSDQCWKEDEFYIPGLHTKPLGDKDPDSRPALIRCDSNSTDRERPVNFQATTNVVLFVRDVLLGEPYFMLIEADEEA